MTKQFVLPGQPTKYARDLRFKITHTRLEIDLDFENKSVNGKVTHTIEPAGTSLESIELDATGMNFNSVRVDGRNARYETRQRSIIVHFDSVVASGSKAIVEIDYSSTPMKGLYFRGPTKDFPGRPVHAFTQGQSEDSKYWYPCYDYPNMRTSTEVIVKAPSNMLVVSNGRLSSVRDSENGKKAWHYVQNVPHVSYLLSIVAGEYEKISTTHDGILVEYYIFADRKQDAPRSFGKTPKMLDFFGKVTDQKYPYEKYAQTVVSDFMYGGMENISATTLTDRTLHDERGHLDFTSDNLVSHELAHQWFGDYLTCKDWSHAWLNEGFATYFNALFKEEDEGRDEFQYHMQSNMDTLVDDIDEHYQRQIVIKKYWDPDELFDSHTYEKGAWVLNSLRGCLGDYTFFKGIRRYVSGHKNSIVETSDFRKALEEESGLDLESFFEQWLYSPGFPDYKASFTWNVDSKTAKLELEQSNAEAEGVPLFTNPIEVRFTFSDGTRVSKTVRMNDRRSAFFFSLEDRPANVNIDPGNWILKKLKFQKPKEMFLFQLEHDENAMERVRACQELAEFKSDDVVDALAKSIDSDKFWGVKLEAAKALGKICTGHAFDALNSRREHPEHRARRGIAIAMRSFADSDSKSEAAIDVLAFFLERDYSYYTRAHAAHSLGYFTKSERALELLKRALSQDSLNDQVRYRAFLGLAEKKDTRAIGLAIDYLENGKDYQGRIGAAHALGKLGKRSPEALEALLAVKKDPDVRVKSEAATSLSHLGDPSAIPELEQWLSSELEGRVRRRLRESIFFLRENVRQSDEITKLSQEVDRLTQENKKLSEKVESLESKVH